MQTTHEWLAGLLVDARIKEGETYTAWRKAVHRKAHYTEIERLHDVYIRADGALAMIGHVCAQLRIDPLLTDKERNLNQ